MTAQNHRKIINGKFQKMIFPLMPGKNILEGLWVQRRTWSNFGLFQQPLFLFSFSLPQHIHTHTHTARPLQVFNPWLVQIKYVQLSEGPHPLQGACLSYSTLRWGPALSAAPGSPTTSHTGRRAASPSSACLSVNHPIYLRPYHIQCSPQGTCQPGLSWLHLCPEGST